MAKVLLSNKLKAKHKIPLASVKVSIIDPSLAIGFHIKYDMEDKMEFLCRYRQNKLKSTEHLIMPYLIFSQRY